MQQTKVFQEYPSLVFWLKKSLYGLKQAPRAWYAKMDAFLLSIGFTRCKSDPNVYLQKHDVFSKLLLFMLMTFSLQVDAPIQLVQLSHL